MIIAGGGPGGHVFPAIAVAEALQGLADVDLVFCGTARGVEAREVPAHGWRLDLVDVEPMKGRGLAGAARAAAVAASATLKGLALVRRPPPCAVLGVGGYAAPPRTPPARLSALPPPALAPPRRLRLA